MCSDRRLGLDPARKRRPNVIAQRHRPRSSPCARRRSRAWSARRAQDTDRPQNSAASKDRGSSEIASSESNPLYSENPTQAASKKNETPVSTTPETAALPLPRVNLKPSHAPLRPSANISSTIGVVMAVKRTASAVCKHSTKVRTPQSNKVPPPIFTWLGTVTACKSASCASALLVTTPYCWFICPAPDSNRFTSPVSATVRRVPQQRVERAK